ncbi:MAG: hypothetical protein K2M14_04040, partial [Muribaculaceae bacterium]|nr:hypothetical protein [Muribaculaceae bacterium]
MSFQRLPAILLTSLLLSCGTAAATSASPSSRTATASKTATTSSGKNQKQSGTKTQKSSTQKAGTQAAGKAQKAPAGKAQKGQTGTSKSSKGQKKRTSAGKAAKRETSATVKRQQQSVNNEIARTQQQIEANDVAVSTNLATLQTLQQEVTAQHAKVTNLRNREQSLQATIAQCSQKIAASEARLAKMRAQYVAAIKKMRAARKRNNTLAFIFSSKNFYQALRRLRYLHTFSDWRARKEQEIKAEVEQLAKQQQTLAAGQAALRTTLSEQETAHRVLTEKQQQQAETVSKLRANGTALRSHLQRKQAEANALNSRVADLIAREQAEAAAAEQRRREEAERRAEAQRRAEAERAEARRLAAEKAAAEKAAA